MSKPTGLSAAPSYNTSAITWTHGKNSHQELYVDSNQSKVKNNCKNGCFLKKTGLGSKVEAYNVTGLQPGTTYYYKIRSVKDCGSKAASGHFTTTARLVVPKVEFINRQHFTTIDPPAVVKCYVNHDDKGAIYALAGGHRLKRLWANFHDTSTAHVAIVNYTSSNSGSNSGPFIAFLPDFTPGTHEVHCKVDRSKAMGSGNSGSYTIVGPHVKTRAENTVAGMPTPIVSNMSSDFFLNTSTVFVDGSPIDLLHK